MTRGQQTSRSDDAYRITVLPGDGIGVEVAEHAQILLNLIGEVGKVGFVLEEIRCGGQYYLEHGTRDWPAGAGERCARADAILLGAVGWPDPKGKGPVTMTSGKMAGYSAVIGNRIALDLYANVRPVRLLPGIQHRLSGMARVVWEPKNVDMVIVRENTEGLYSGMGGMMAAGGVNSLATDVRVITRRASERVIRQAFEICRCRGRGAPADGKQRVTCIVKNNVLDGCRLFAEVFEEVGAHYPEIERELAIVDAFAQWLLVQPEHYDVCVTTNMFGDILTDLAAVLQGGMGMAVGCNLGDEHAMFEPIHGSAPPLAGKDRANPMAMFLATAEMLAWLGQRHEDESLLRAAAAVQDGVASIVLRGEPLTADLVGDAHAAPMSQVTQAVLDEVRQRLA